MKSENIDRPPLPAAVDVVLRAQRLAFPGLGQATKGKSSSPLTPKIS
jgi:hypothetical protein